MSTCAFCGNTYLTGEGYPESDECSEICSFKRTLAIKELEATKLRDAERYRYWRKRGISDPYMGGTAMTDDRLDLRTDNAIAQQKETK